MRTIDAVIAMLETAEMRNVYKQISQIVTPRLIDDFYSIVLDGEKLLNLWIVKEISSEENKISLNSTITDEKIMITGYFGISSSGYSIDKFNMLIDSVIDCIRQNGASPELAHIKRINKKNDQTLFANILCHTCDITIELFRIN